MDNDIVKKCMKWQQENCEKLFGSKIESINIRLDANDKALAKQDVEIERRLDILNHLRSQFTDGLIDLERRVARLETRSVVWITAIAACFALLQFVLKIWK